MKKFFKWAGIVLGSLILILVAVYTFIYFKVDGRFNKEYAVKVQPIPISSDSAAIALGKHVAAIKGCNDCHGKNFGGNVVIDDPGLGKIAGPNITLGKGGLVSRHGSFTDEDYVRAIKHGIGKNNKTLKLMPSYEYTSLSQKDLGALISYLKTIPAVDNEAPEISLNPLAYVLTNFDKLPMVVAEKVDHAAISAETVNPEITATYGKYVAVSCIGCHRDNYMGGEALIPGSPLVPNISGAGGAAGKWTEAQFMQTLRTGVTPEGKKLDPKFMPWPMAKEYTDVEIKSLYLFLKNLPA